MFRDRTRNPCKKKFFLKTILSCLTQINESHVSFLFKVRIKILKKKVFLEKTGRVSVLGSLMSVNGRCVWGVLFDIDKTD